MDIPTFKGENLQSSVSENSLTIEDPSDPLEKWVSSDNAVMNIEDMA